MWRKVSTLARMHEETTAETIVRDTAALIVMALFLFAAAKGAAILGAVVTAARLQ